jgi:hypothetical protein
MLQLGEELLERSPAAISGLCQHDRISNAYAFGQPVQ